MRVQKGYQKNFCRRFLSGMAFLFLFFLMGTGRTELVLLFFGQ